MKRALSDMQIRHLKPEPGQKHTKKYFDGGGLFLAVEPSGSKIFRYKYKRPNGRVTQVSLGHYREDLTLEQARELHRELRSQLKAGVDPAHYRRSIIDGHIESGEQTFEKIFREWYERLMTTKDLDHQGKIDYRKGVERRVESFILPWLGRRPISEITSPELFSVLERIWERSRGADGKIRPGTIDTAWRTRQVVGRVFDYAKARGLVNDNPSTVLAEIMPPRPKKKHFAAAIKPRQIGDMLLLLESYQGDPSTVVAINLLPHLFLRPGREFRLGRWEEIDWEKGEWGVPGERMKHGKPHAVPLSRQAIEWLQQIEPITRHRSQYIFAGRPRGGRRDGPISASTMNGALRRMGIDTKLFHTSHGWRASARTLLHESGVEDFVIEHQLAHLPADALADTYNRTAFLRQRVKMMQAWSDMLDSWREEARARRDGESPAD